MQADNQASSWKQIAFFLLTLGVLVVCALLLQPFLIAIVGAIVIAIITERPYLWLAARLRQTESLRRPGPGSGHPQRPGPHLLSGTERRTARHRPSSVVSAARLHSNRSQTISNATQRSPSKSSRPPIPSTCRTPLAPSAPTLGEKFASLIGTSIGAITQIVAMLFILFFLYRDREIAARFARSLLPLEDEESTLLLSRMRGTIYATALGRLAIAALQGTLAGLAYWVLHVPNALLWAILTGVMAMIPAFGAVLVWAPIAPLPRPLRPLDPGSSARHLGRRHRQPHRQLPLPHPGRPAASPALGRGASLHPRRNHSLRNRRNRPRTTHHHRSLHPARDLASPRARRFVARFLRSWQEAVQQRRAFAGSPTMSGASSTCVLTRLSATILPKTF